MAGGILQLVAYGIQDLYLTGDPQITYFKIIYRRHTNFSVESIIQNFSQPANFGETVTCTFTRLGDLISDSFIYVELPAIPKFMYTQNGNEDKIKKFAWARYIGFALLQEITLEIGGKQVDKHYGEWLYLWSELTNRQNRALDKMVGNLPELYDFTNGKNPYGLYIPLSFWFCRNVGLSIPIISLNGSDVKITVMFRKLEECTIIGPTHSIEILEDVVPFKKGDYIYQTVNGQTIRGYVIDYDYIQKRLYYVKIHNQLATKKCFDALKEPSSSTLIINNIAYKNNIPYRIYNSLTNLYCTPTPNKAEYIESVILPIRPRFVNAYIFANYIYLDTDERFKFARSNLEYLIEQLQYNQRLGITSPNLLQDLNLNHPCKSHVWICQLDLMIGPGTMNDLFNYTDSPIRYPNGKLFGQNLVRKSNLLMDSESRFNERDNIYTNLVVPYQHYYRGPVIGINAYSFGLFPEDIQPSSACNMSKIADISMMMKLSSTITTQNTCRVRSYTMNYNILRIFFNQGGVAFV